MIAVNNEGEHEKAGHTASISACRKEHKGEEKHKHTNNDNEAAYPVY
jgi:hypothetical protein